MDRYLAIRWWNLAQVFTNASRSRERALWPDRHPHCVKAAYWDTSGPSITLSSERPPVAAEETGIVPAQKIIALPEIGGDRPWTATSAGEQIVGIARQAGGVLLTPAVWTHQTDAIRRELERESIETASEIACPHGRVFYWNTRTGMRDLFLTVPEVAQFVVPSVICHDPDEVRMTAARLGTGDIVVKSNFSLGGVGTIRLNPGSHFDPEAFGLSGETAGMVGGKDKQFAWAWRGEPYVVERLCGEPRTNISITLDAATLSDETVVMIGASEQILSGEFAYSGIRSLQPAIRALLPPVEAAVGALGRALARRGYAGHFNTDFGITKDGTIFLCDLNVRRSAPLDVHMIVRRLNAAGSDCAAAYWQEDGAVTAASTDRDLATLLRRAGLLFVRGRGVIPLSVPIAAGSGNNFRVSFLYVEQSHESLKELRNAVQDVCLAS